MEICKECTAHHAAPITELSISQQYKRTKREDEQIKQKVVEALETVKKSMFYSIMKDYPHYYNKSKENPLSEAEVIQLVTDKNLVDTQIINICQFMRQKWGNGVKSYNSKRKEETN